MVSNINCHMITSKAMAYGGYNYSFVNSDPPSEYQCHICTFVAHDPQQVTCCYNIYCKTCLETLQEKGQDFNCPTCREPLTGNYFKDGRAEREIQSLRVYCSNTDSGCQWVGTINDIEAHLNSCPYQLIPCTNECGAEVLRMYLDDHIEEECPKRIVECEYCEEEGTHQLITSSSHLDECPDYPVKCSNEECSKKIPRRLLASHNETCPKAIITCEYNTVGCNKIMKREEQEEHNKESVQEHLRLAVQQVHSLRLHNPINKVIKVDQYFKKKEENEDWYSDGFYTSPGGYKMSLNVIVNGHGKRKGKHVSCFICLMSGEYDDTLEWPFRGEVTIELLNQLEDKNHKKYIITFNNETGDEYSQRVSKRSRGSECGNTTFLLQAELEYNPITNCQYLKDDSLYFRVSVKAISKTKLWLVGL